MFAKACIIISNEKQCKKKKKALFLNHSNFFSFSLNKKNR